VSWQCHGILRAREGYLDLTGSDEALDGFQRTVECFAFFVLQGGFPQAGDPFGAVFAGLD
jgi:hypothetical protein